MHPRRRAEKAEEYGSGRNKRGSLNNKGAFIPSFGIYIAATSYIIE